MKREILFRGRTIKTRFGGGKWIEGFYVMSCAGRAKMEPAIITGTEKGCFMTEFVDPATVGQFTGLCDKNGKKIFEDDVLRDGLGDDGVVTYFESIASFKYRVGNEVWNLNEGDPNRSTQLQYTEVIGNIHDTPKLAKEEAE